jgi:hypothetical protein
MVSKTLALAILLSICTESATAQARDTAAVVAAVARYDFVTGPNVYPTMGAWRVRDSTTFKAVREIFRGAKVRAPELNGDLPPCGGFLPWPPNDTGAPGNVLWYLVYAIDGDSAKAISFLSCRYGADNRGFLRGKGYELRRGPNGWRVQKQTGSIVS